MKDYPCPACGFQVFDEPPGSYDICPICGWEDDDVQLRFPGMTGGANKQSLFEYQRSFLRGVPIDVQERKGYRRDPAWRPLNLKECIASEKAPRTGLDYFQAAAEGPYDEYYWRKA